MDQEEIWGVDAAQRYDTPGIGMFAPDLLGPTIDRLGACLFSRIVTATIA
jgi:hypothetical protein